MSEVSFASLEPSLLARKGGAKPAMRPQLTHLSEVVSEDELEDLGWNDMGDDGNHPVASDDHDTDVDGATGANVFALPRSTNVQQHGATGSTKSAANEDDNAHEHAEPFARELLQRKPDERSGDDLSAAAMPLPKGDAGEADGLLVRSKSARKAVADTSRGTAQRRTAFTLRLDRERHLKLRLAATIHGMSAQALVTDALDTMFARIDNLDALTARIHAS